jgi:hypothetical protein
MEEITKERLNGKNKEWKKLKHRDINQARKKKER